MTTTDSLSHPYRQSSGKMPHELDHHTFDKWLRHNKINEHDYWVEIGSNEDLTEKYGTPLLTRQLSTDQRGWAKQRFPTHYRTNGAKWYVRPEKKSIPVPAVMHNKPHRRRRHT